MSSEGKGYTPEDVIQTEGPNKGNIKDKSLAEVGANAEDRKRSKFGFNMNRILSPWQTEHDIQEVGQDAMGAVINKKARADLAEKGVSPAGQRKGGDVAESIFLDSQKAYTEDRVSDEIETNLETKGKNY